MSRKPPAAPPAPVNQEAVLQDPAPQGAARRGGAPLAPAAAAGLLLALVLLGGSNWPIMKVGITLIPPFWFAVVRLGLGALTLFLLLAALGRLRLPPREDLPVVCSVGLLQMASYLALVNLALESVPAGRSAVLAYTTPFWVAPGAALLLGSLALLPFAWWREGLPQPVWGWELWAILAYNGPFATGLAYWVSLSLTRGLPAVTVSLGFLGVPAVGLSGSVLLLGEPLPWSLLAGLVLVLAGLVAVSLPARPPAAARGGQS